MTNAYINRIRRVVRQMLNERDEDGVPVWMRPDLFDRRETANRFHDELCYRLRLSGENATQMRMKGETATKTGGHNDCTRLRQMSTKRRTAHRELVRVISCAVVL